jgi:(2Fe-2S) ferredoxin
MKLLHFAGLLIALLLGTAAVGAQQPGAQVALTLERTACFGACPMYTVTVYDDGTVVYEGERFVDVTGTQTTEIDPATVEMMVQAFSDAGYFGWDEAYDRMTVSDLPTVITSVTRNGETHRIVRYEGDSSAPLALPYLEAWLDRMARTAMWTGQSPDLHSIHHSGDAPVLTIERTPCFGFCPEYSAAIYADGTVVYAGFANVDRLGVHVLKVEDFAVESVLQQADALGYFGWQDAYDDIFMTDQAYVITSIRTGSDDKRITRYGGDPTAPVGLVWIEDSIDQLLAEAAS